MTGMVQVAVAGDVTEAEEIQAILTEVGIESALEPEDEADDRRARPGGRSRSRRTRSTR